MLETTLIILAIALLGWVSGGLVNYLADVLPLRRKLVHPFCVECAERIPWSRAVLWPGGCPVCSGRRSHRWRSWAVHLIFAGAAVWMWVSPPLLGFWAGLLVLVYFGVVVVIDIEHRLIMHPVSLAGAGLALLIGLWLHEPGGTLLGGLAGFGFMLAIYIVGILFVRVVSLRRGGAAGGEALGFGDVMLSGVLGLMLGWPVIIVGLLAAVLLAGLVSFLFIAGMIAARRYRAFVPIPYGPFLIASAILFLYFPSYALAILGQ